MALRLPPTPVDVLVSHLAARYAQPDFERVAEMATYLADERLLYAVTAGLWALSRFATPRRRAEANHLAVCVVATGLLPHVIKRAVNQERPDRLMVHGRRRGIPKSGRAYDAFPSGHAMHLGALASLLAASHPRKARWVWLSAIGLASTRVFLLAHWLSDVVCGFALGVAIERATRTKSDP